MTEKGIEIDLEFLEESIKAMKNRLDRSEIFEIARDLAIHIHCEKGLRGYRRKNPRKFKCEECLLRTFVLCSGKIKDALQNCIEYYFLSNPNHEYVSHAIIPYKNVLKEMSYDEAIDLLINTRDDSNSDPAGPTVIRRDAGGRPVVRSRGIEYITLRNKGGKQLYLSKMPFMVILFSKSDRVYVESSKKIKVEDIFLYCCED